MMDNLVDKLIEELQKLVLPSTTVPPPAKLSRADDFDRWESRMQNLHISEFHAEAESLYH
ncbi:unnamed protein product, partial [Dibothriocephalus latus]